MKPEDVRYYLSIGAALFPIPAGQKAPTGIVNSFATDWSKNALDWERWDAAHPKCNFGIVAGPSGIIIPDIDTKNGEHIAAEAWRDTCSDWGGEFKPQVRSARGGQHCYFQVPPEIDATTLGESDLVKGIINIRAGNGYTVAAGSYYNGRPKGEASKRTKSVDGNVDSKNRLVGGRHAAKGIDRQILPLRQDRGLF
jgi:hypothetical protein